MTANAAGGLSDGRRRSDAGRWRLAGWLALALVVVPAPGRADEHDRLRIGLQAFDTSFIPDESYLNLSAATLYAWGFAARPMVAPGRSGDWECRLCTRLPTLENGLVKVVTDPGGAERLEVTWEIRPDLYWGDGTPLTSTDFTVPEAFIRRTGGHALADGAQIIGSEVIDAKRFKVFWDRPTTAFDHWGLLPVRIDLDGPQMASANSLQDWRARSLYRQEITRPGLWLGPYRPRKIGSDRIGFVRNEAWRGRLSPFNEIEVRSLEGGAALLNSLQRGDIELIPVEAAVPYQTSNDKLSSVGEGPWSIRVSPSSTMQQIFLNNRDPILAQVSVRRALSESIDRDGLTVLVGGDRSLIAHSFLTPTNLFFDPRIPPMAFDPMAATLLLDRSGWQTTADGTRADSLGRRLVLHMLCAGDRSKAADFLQEKWRSIGIIVDIDYIPFDVLMSRLQVGDFQMAFVGWAVGAGQLPIGIGSGTPLNPNITGFADQEVDLTISRLRSELYQENSHLLWSILQRRFNQLLPYLPLFVRPDVTIYPSWMEGSLAVEDPMASIYVENWGMH